MIFDGILIKVSEQVMLVKQFRKFGTEVRIGLDLRKFFVIVTEKMRERYHLFFLDFDFSYRHSKMIENFRKKFLVLSYRYLYFYGKN